MYSLKKFIQARSASQLSLWPLSLSLQNPAENKAWALLSCIYGLRTRRRAEYKHKASSPNMVIGAMGEQGGQGDRASCHSEKLAVERDLRQVTEQGAHKESAPGGGTANRALGRDMPGAGQIRREPRQ